jgi:voltage-gated potassium channel
MKKPEHSYRNLLIALLLAFVSYPVLIVDGRLGRAIELLLVLLVLTTGSIIRFGRTRRALFTFIASSLVVVTWVWDIVVPDQYWLPGMKVLLVVLFMGQITWWLSLDVFAAPHVSTTNRLYGAVCIYLLTGIFFANSFAALNLLAPGSFACSTSLCGDDFHRDFQHGLHLYYSFATLTTVGYGDVIPMTAFAAMLSNMEAIIGQMYTAIVVARLVGLHIMDTLASK